MRVSNNVWAGRGVTLDQLGGRYIGAVANERASLTLVFKEQNNKKQPIRKQLINGSKSALNIYIYI